MQLLATVGRRLFFPLHIQKDCSTCLLLPFKCNAVLFHPWNHCPDYLLQILCDSDPQTQETFTVDLYSIAQSESRIAVTNGRGRYNISALGVYAIVCCVPPGLAHGFMLFEVWVSSGGNQ